MIRLATWNVNSLRARLPCVETWLLDQPVDVILLQETKCLDEQFPKSFFEDLGYNLAVSGQKTFNGVAIASKFPLEDIKTTSCLGDDFKDARYIEAVLTYEQKIFRVASVYCPNGQSFDSPKFLEKLNFFEALRRRLQTLLAFEKPLVIGGDFNVAPTGLDTSIDDGQLLCSLQERRAFHSLLHLGYRDAYRSLNAKDPGFTWWDYRSSAFDKDQGMRIDHALVSPEISVLSCTPHRGVRALLKPSDHTPLYLEIDI